MKTPHRRARRPALAFTAAAVAAGITAIAPAEAQAAEIDFKVDKHVLVGDAVNVRGQLEGAPDQEITIQRTRGGDWNDVETVTTGGDGSFDAKLDTDALGKMKIRAVGPDGRESEKRKAIAYREAPASYYGPGLYGNQLACGGTLQPGTIGVANKTLPCGTKVHLHYRGRSVTAPVIDRGPYAGNRVYDLTEATKERLGFGSTGNVWADK